MQSRRGFLFKIAAGLAAMAMVVVGTVVADELLGAITKVDVEGKKITVVEKGSDKEIDLKITDESKEVRKGEEESVDLEKLDRRVKKAEDAGRKVYAKISHEKGVATKIQYQQRKKKAE